tara:strand:- start:42457 stop:43002 length:546 start_codon:yes stop_codon:yes gene_type:complete
MQSFAEWIRRPLWVSVSGLSLSISGTTVAHASWISDHTGDQGTNVDTGTTGSETRYEQWQYVSIPQFGIASVQEALTEGTAANEAFESVGEPIESYEPQSLLGTIQNNNNGAVVVYMLPLRCLGDYNADNVVNLYDMPYFIDYYLAQDPAGDLTRDGLVDIRDQILFIELTAHLCYDAWGW